MNPGPVTTKNKSRNPIGGCHVSELLEENIRNGFSPQYPWPTLKLLMLVLELIRKAPTNDQCSGQSSPNWNVSNIIGSRMRVGDILMHFMSQEYLPEDFQELT